MQITIREAKLEDTAHLQGQSRLNLFATKHMGDTVVISIMGSVLFDVRTLCRARLGRDPAGQNLARTSLHIPTQPGRPLCHRMLVSVVGLPTAIHAETVGSSAQDSRCKARTKSSFVVFKVGLFTRVST